MTTPRDQTSRRAYAELLTMAETARHLQVSTKVLKRWVEQGRITAVRRPISGHRRFTVAEVARVRQEVLGLPPERSAMHQASEAC